MRKIALAVCVSTLACRLASAQAAPAKHEPQTSKPVVMVIEDKFNKFKAEISSSYVMREDGARVYTVKSVMLASSDGGCAANPNYPGCPGYVSTVTIAATKEDAPIEVKGMPNLTPHQIEGRYAEAIKSILSTGSYAVNADIVWTKPPARFCEKFQIALAIFCADEWFFYG